MKRNKIRLTESQLHNVIKESVRRVLREMWDDDDDEMGDFTELNRIGEEVKNAFWNFLEQGGQVKFERELFGDYVVSSVLSPKHRTYFTIEIKPKYHQITIYLDGDYDKIGVLRDSDYDEAINIMKQNGLNADIL